MNEVPMSIPNLILTKNYLTASFLWRLKSSISTTTVYGVERYVCLFDVIDLQNMICYQYFAYLTPSRRKNNVWEKTRLVFIPVSNNPPDLQGFFYQLFESVKNTQLYQYAKEEMDERISGFPQFCFTYDCLRTLLTLFYDYYSFESMV